MVVCCGNVAFDLIAKKEDVKGGMDFHACPGGSVLNTAIILARLGLPVSMLAKTGDDLLGNSLAKTMRREGIKARYVMKDKDIKTGLAFARIDEKGNSSYLFYKTKGPQTRFRRSDIPISVFRKALVFHTGSLYSYNDHTFHDTIRFLKMAKKENVFTTYDPNWREGRIKNKKIVRGRIAKILPYIDLLKLSDTEATVITGAKTLSAALKKLDRKAVVTLGEKGSFYWDGKKKMFQPALKVRVADTIGAGDSFTAGLIYRYYVTREELFWKEMKINLAFASAMSGLICTKHGAAAGVSSLRQVMNFFKARSSPPSRA